MKKYSQLLLLIISITSLILFLIYRHEYNRLHYVLEVFNFFGQPCNISNLQKTENVVSQHDWGSPPTWQEEDIGYIYSAFLTSQTEIRAISLQSGDKLVPRNCYIWLEDKRKPLYGKFKYTKIMNDVNAPLNLYFYICTFPNQAPYAVSFSYKLRKENDLKKIMLTSSYQPNEKIAINTTICVSPSIFSKRRFIEFLSYHKLIGIDSFIFYNRDVSHRLAKIVRNLSTALGLQLTFYPWNYPKLEGSLTRAIVENDCRLRTFGKTHYATTLELNEFVVPTKVYGFNALMEQFDADSERFTLPVQRFCITVSDTTKPISVSNVEVADDVNFNLVRYIYRNDQRKSDISAISSDRGFVSIHKYLKCTANPTKTHSDDTFLKYGTDLVRSTLFQLLLQNQI